MSSKNIKVGAGVAIYCRVSTQEQGDEGISISTQEARCRQYIAQMQHLIEPQISVYIDSGYSGKLGYRKDGVKGKFRPELTRMLNDIKDGKISHVVIYRNDRLCRSLKLWLEILEDFIFPNEVELLSVCEPVNPLTSQGKLSLNILAAVAEYQREWTGDNIRDTLRFKKENGFRVGNPPYGWRWSQERVDGHRLVERDEDEGKVVIDICEKIRSGWNFARLSRYLQSQGIKSPSGNDHWHPSVIRRIALDPFHAGLVVGENGESRPGKHYGLRYFEPEYHEQVVAEVKRRGPKAPMTFAVKTHLLLPKLRCATCGARLYVDKREDHRHRVYWCKNRSVTRGRTCPGARAKIAWADGVVVEVLRKLSQDERIIAGAEAIIERELRQNTGKLKQEKAKLEWDLREDERRLAEMVEKLADGEISAVGYKAFEDKVKARIEQRMERLRAIDKELAGGEADRQRIQRAKEMLRDFNKVWEGLTIDEKRKAIDLLIEDLLLSQTHLIIKPYFADPIEVRIPIGRFRSGKPGDPHGLSQRELSILKMLGDGLTVKQIAERTGLAMQTVYGHISRIYSWLGVDNAAAAVEMARPVIEEAGELPTDRRLNVSRQFSDEPTEKMLMVLRAVAEHPTQAEAYRALGIPYVNGSHRLRALMKKTGTNSLDALFEVAVQRGWIESIPERKEKGLVFTKAEAEMVRACLGAKSIAAAGRSLGLSRVAATSRMHTVYKKLGVHSLKEALARLKELGLDPADLPVATVSN